jgi:hypothetical protein
MWFSDYIQKAVPMTSISAERQDEAKRGLYNLTEKVNSLSEVLKQSEKDDLKKLGDLLPHAMEVPGLDYVYVGENGKICLVCWGFKSDEPQRRDFKLFKTLQEAHSESALRLEKTLEEEKVRKDADASTTHDKQVYEKETVSSFNYKEPDYGHYTNPPFPKPPLYQESKIRIYWLWGGLLSALFLILFVILWFFLPVTDMSVWMRQYLNSTRHLEPYDNYRVEITNLKSEIAKLKEQLNKCNGQGTTGNVSNFAQGHWRVGSDIINNKTKEKVEVSYNFFDNGTGTLVLTEKDGTKCTADFSVILEKDNLIMKQSKNATCDKKNLSGLPQDTICKQQDKNSAQCMIKSKSGYVFSFILNREK